MQSGRYCLLSAGISWGTAIAPLRRRDVLAVGWRSVAGDQAIEITD